MPVSHIGLVVSHLPSSTSFFLSALQPLGYRYIEQSGGQIGLGIEDADFFLCQETTEVKAGAAHIALTAPSITAVQDFYAAALTAGGRPNGAPAARCGKDGRFNAAVLDLDGNSIEVVYRNEADTQNHGTIVERSRVITWQRNVSSRSYRDDHSAVSTPSLTTVSDPVAIQQTAPVSDAGDGAAKKIIGTLLGAAAGAAVAYAMVSSERDSAKKEKDLSALLQAKASIKLAADFISHATSSPARPAFETAIISPPARSVYAQGLIEPAPSSHYTSTPSGKQPTYVGETRAIEYAPPSSVASSQARSRYTPQRSVTNPEGLVMQKARSVASVSEYQEAGRSIAPSSLISSFVPEGRRRSSGGSILSYHSTRSAARSSCGQSREEGKDTGKGVRQVYSSLAPEPRVPTKADSVVGSILGRCNKSTASNHENFVEDLESEHLTEDDADTIVPSDSVSNVGSSSRHRHRKHRSKKHEDGSTISKHSSSSHRSHRSRRSHSRHHPSDDSSAESEKRKHKSHPSVISESSSVSTVKPIQASSQASHRKDSVTRSQYDGLFDDVQSQHASRTSPSTRQITPSMVSAAKKNPHRTMVNYHMAQKARLFDP